MIFMAFFAVFVLVFSLHQAGFNLLYSTFILIGVAGLSQMLYFLARRGFFRVSRWAGTAFPGYWADDLGRSRDT